MISIVTGAVTGRKRSGGDNVTIKAINRVFWAASPLLESAFRHGRELN